MRIIRYFLDFIFYSNLFIAFAAVAFTVETMLLLHIPLQWHPYLFITFFATLFDYCLHRDAAIRKHEKLPDNVLWIKNHRIIFYTIFTASFIGLIISLLFVKLVVLFFLIPMAFITISYSMPVFQGKRNFYRLFNFPAAKIIVLTLVWALTTVLLPVIQAGEKIFYIPVLLLTIERFLFVFALAIPFDIRDREADETVGLKTLPVLFGNNTSIALAAVALTVFILFELFSMVYFPHLYINYYTVALITSAVITWIYVRRGKTAQHAYYYFGLLDGMILLQSLLVFAAYLLM